MNKLARISFGVLGIVFLLAIFYIIYLVVAAPVVTPGSGNVFNFNEDITNQYNITVWDIDYLETANITQVNVTLPGIAYLFNSQSSSLSTTTVFRNSSTVLSWVNVSGLVMNLTKESFWFNATASTPGTYNISVMTLNATGSSFSNITLIVNDTTNPSMNIVSPSHGNNSISATSVIVNVTASDNAELSNIRVILYNSSGEINSTNSVTSPLYYEFSSLSAGTYFYNVTVNDTSNRLNHSQLVTVNVGGNSFAINGTTYDTNGNILGGVNVTINVMSMPSGGPPPTYNPVSTLSNGSGWFNLVVPGNSSWMYQIVLRYTNSTTNSVSYVGQSLPHFPYQELSRGISTNFFLKNAGTLNITALNQSADRVSFNYQVKDTTLGYTIASNWESRVAEAIVYVPKDKNYSVMIYPDQSLPISFNWNNFSSASDYNINSLSTYNATTSVLKKMFNTTNSLIRLEGIVNGTAGGIGVAGWSEFTIMPFLLEPGNMIYMDHGGLPFNMSAWEGGTDIYNYATGAFNITIPAPAESQTVLLFVSGKNGSNYYGAYRNVSISSSTGHTRGVNITMYKMLGDNLDNVSLQSSTGNSNVNISTKKQTFTLVNATSNASLTMQSGAHVETTVDYSAYNGMEFTFMAEVAQNANNFALPLLNVSGIKEINFFSQSFAPKSISERTSAQIVLNSNISLNIFNPQALDGTSGSSISIALYMSNSSCDLPGSESSCAIGSSSNMANFNPLSAVIGGGKLSFRMGLGGVLVHYVNVDLLASGPPDALFEDNNDITERTSGGFGKAMKFGGQGPKIYDYVLISMPYTEGNSSTTGLNESATVNLSIPIFYDENWNIIWNSSVNGSAPNFAANYSHYSTKVAQWEYLVNGTACTTNVSVLNITNPCYIDTTNDKIWIRLPHFSGTGTSMTGSVVTANTSSSSGDSGGGGGSSGATNHIYTIAQDKLEAGYMQDLKKDDIIKFPVNGTTHSLKLTVVGSGSVTLEISSVTQTVILQSGEEKKVDVDVDGNYDINVKLENLSSSGVAKITLSKAIGVVPNATSETGNQTNTGTGNQTGLGTGTGTGTGATTSWWSSSRNRMLAYFAIALVVVLSVVWYILSKKNRYITRGY